jgi:hypothetical protein
MVVTAPTAKVYDRQLRAGDEFDCPEKEAKLWAALARAKQVTQDGKSVEATVEASIEDMQPEARRRGRYARRDLRSED